MSEIGAFEAKNTLGSLLDRVENGEEIVITRQRHSFVFALIVAALTFAVARSVAGLRR